MGGREHAFERVANDGRCKSEMSHHSYYNVRETPTTPDVLLGLASLYNKITGIETPTNN